LRVTLTVWGTFPFRIGSKKERKRKKKNSKKGKEEKTGSGAIAKRDGFHKGQWKSDGCAFETETLKRIGENGEVRREERGGGRLD